MGLEDFILKNTYHWFNDIKLSVLIIFSFRIPERVELHVF